MRKVYKILIWSFVILVFIGLTSTSAFVFYLETSIDKVMTKERQEKLYSEISKAQELPVSYYETLDKYFPNHFKDGVWDSIFKQITGRKRNTCQCREIYIWGGLAKIPFEHEIIALELEEHFSQRKCYEYNIKISEFGSNTRGITEAANFFYKKEISELTENEILELNIIPNAPTLYSPIINKQNLERAVEEIRKNN